MALWLDVARRLRTYNFALGSLPANGNHEILNIIKKQKLYVTLKFKICKEPD
jgi:hypothetical protein